jgi:hypothetical protein
LRVSSVVPAARLARMSRRGRGRVQGSRLPSLSRVQVANSSTQQSKPTVLSNRLVYTRFDGDRSSLDNPHLVQSSRG